MQFQTLQTPNVPPSIVVGTGGFGARVGLGAGGSPPPAFPFPLDTKGTDGEDVGAGVGAGLGAGLEAGLLETGSEDVPGIVVIWGG